MRPSRTSLRRKIFAAVLLASLLPSLVGIWLVARASEGDLRAAALGEAHTAGALSRAIAQERATRLLAIAEAIALTPGLGEAIATRDRDTILRLTQPWLRRLAGPTVAVTDERGVMILRTYAPDRFGDDVAATTKGLVPALRGQPGFSTESAGLRGLSIRGFGPVLLDARVVGVAAVTQNLDQEFLAGLQAAGGFETFAIFPDGATVGNGPDAATAAGIVTDDREHTTFAPVAGRLQAVHAWPLADPDGTTAAFLGIVFPLDNLVLAQNRVRLTAAGAAFVALVAAGALAWLLSRELVSPIERISRAARGIAGGAVGSIPSVRTGDELEELSTSLSSMVATLSDQTHRLEALNAQLARDRGRAQALAEASRAFAEARLDVEAVLSAVAHRIAEILEGGCVVRELSEDRRWLTAVAFHHTDPAVLAFWQDMLATPQPADEGINGRVVQTGVPHLLAHPTRDEVRATILPEHWPFLERFMIHSLLIVPLRVRGSSVGTLAAQRTTPNRPFTEEDKLFLQDLADRAALAIDHARLYAEAQAAVRDRDQFLSIAAHELRTPVTSIKGHAQMLLRAHRRGTLAPDRLIASLDVLVTAANRLAQLTNDLLDVGRLRTGRLALRPEEVDLTVFVRGLILRFQDTLDGSHHFVLDAPAEPCRAYVDLGRVEQVLTNLLDNAVKYSPAGSHVPVSVRSEDGGVAVAVQDSGIGIPDGAAERIFEPFGRAANATASRLPGMGLGLYVSRGIVQQHGGWIRAESPGEDQGSTFTVWLPCRRDEPPDSARNS